jgi:hypothetical protein
MINIWGRAEMSSINILEKNTRRIIDGENYY